MPDTLDIEDVLSIDVTPLSSIPTSGVDATPCPDMSVARSVSVELVFLSRSIAMIPHAPVFPEILHMHIHGVIAFRF